MTSPTSRAVLQSLRSAVADRQLRCCADQELLRRFLEHRDEAAFEAVVRQHGPMVLDVCRGMLPNEADAEDAFQATFLVLARKAAAVREAASLASWLHGVAYRTAWKARTGFARRRKHESRVVVRASTDAGDDLTWREVRQVVHQELDGLAEHYRAPLVSCYLEGRTQDEAAAQLGLAKGTLKGRLERGRALLRARLARRGLGPAAVLVVTGWPAATTAGVSASLVRLAVEAATKGTGHALSASKVKLALVAALAVGLLGVAGAYFGRTEVADDGREAKATAKPAEADTRRADRHGDVLPDGALNRLGTLRFRHGYELRAAVFGPGDAVLFSAGSDRAIRVWDASNGKELARLTGHAGKVNSLALSPDGKLLASASDDRTVVLWDAQARKEMRRLEGHQGSVSRVAFSPDGKTLASAGADESVRLWDVATGREQRRLKLPGAKDGADAVTSLSFAPDGKALGCGFRGAADVPAYVMAWQVDTGKELRKFDQCATHAFVADGRLMTASMERLRLWNLATGEKVQDLPVKGMERDQPGGFGKGWTLESLAVVSPDGKSIAAVTREYSDATWAAQVVRVWDVATGKLKFGVGQTPYGIPALAFSRDSKTLAVAPTHGAIEQYDTQTGKPRGDSTPGHQGTVRCVAFTPDGKRVVTGGYDFTCRLWDLATGAELRRFEHNDMVMDLALSPDGRTLVVGCGGTTNTPLEALFVWDVNSGRSLGRFRIETDKPAPIFCHSAVHAVAFAPDGKTFALAAFDEKVRIWDAGTLRELRQFPTRANVFHLAFTPDGLAVVGNGGNGPVVAWDPATGRELRRYEHAAGRGVSFALSPDGRLLATTDGKELRLWETVTGRERLRLPAKTRLVAFSADSRWIACHGESRRVKVWDAATGREALELAGHTGWVDGAAFSPRGTRLATGSWDSTVLVWELAGRLHRSPVVLEAEGRDKLWESLADADPAKAQGAMSAVADAGDGGVTFLQERLKPARPDPERAKRARQWIEELDSDRFEVREQATEGLREMKGAAEPYLRDALKVDTSLERRRRIQVLVTALERDLPPPGRLRDLRAVEVLERLGSPDARRLLDSLAKGDATHGLTREAKSALERLDRTRAPD